LRNVAWNSAATFASRLSRRRHLGVVFIQVRTEVFERELSEPSNAADSAQELHRMRAVLRFVCEFVRSRSRGECERLGVEDNAVILQKCCQARIGCAAQGADAFPAKLSDVNVRKICVSDWMQHLARAQSLAAIAAASMLTKGDQLQPTFRFFVFQETRNPPARGKDHQRMRSRLWVRSALATAEASRSFSVTKLMPPATKRADELFPISPALGNW